MLLKKILGIKKKVTNNKIKYYFLGIPILKEKYNEVKIKRYFCGIPILRIRYIDGNVKIYFLGIRVLNLKQKYITIEKEIESRDLSMIKAFEIFESRKDCIYEEKQ